MQCQKTVKLPRSTQTYPQVEHLEPGTHWNHHLFYYPFTFKPQQLLFHKRHERFKYSSDCVNCIWLCILFKNYFNWFRFSQSTCTTTVLMFFTRLLSKLLFCPLITLQTLGSVLKVSSLLTVTYGPVSMGGLLFLKSPHA